jgi:hypothetical protein
VRRRTRALSARAFSVWISGPWPPYHFVEWPK